MTRLAVVLLAAAALARPAHAQLPEKPVNLEVLPKDMTTEQVVAVMRDFTFSLGVRCTYCHVGREGAPLDSFDFASDDKHAKEMARGMMRMVQRINAELLPEILDHHASTVAVRCATCHRGAARPVMLEDTLGVVAERFGADSLVAVYGRLRERHHGRFAYDFGERSLNVLASRLTEAGRAAEARAVLELNARNFPASANAAFELGKAYEAAGERALAIEQYERVLTIQPEHAGARARLERLSGGSR